jgi:excisionase family DNA binding protein
MNNLPEEFFSLKDAAEYAHVSRQAVYLAIHKRGLKAKKVDGQWRISRKDYDEWRAQKYNRDLVKQDGEFLFDLDKGTLSVNQAAKVISESLKRHYHAQHLYYLLRLGKLKAMKKRTTWVLFKEDVVDIIEKELGKEENLFKKEG